MTFLTTTLHLNDLSLKSTKLVEFGQREASRGPRGARQPGHSKGEGGGGPPLVRSNTFTKVNRV